MSNVAAVAPAGARLNLHGQGGELLVIVIVNLLLKIVTLGIYHFWGKTRVRRYLWSQSSFDGERFEYTGQGQELFFGFLKAIGVILLVVLAFGLLAAGLSFIHQSLLVVAMVALYATMFYLMAVGIYGGRQYLLSRTRFRGIRFAQGGSPFTYGGKMVGYIALSILTLGFYTPFMNNHLVTYMMNNMSFGGEQFSYDGKGKDLFGRYVVSFLLTIPTLGLIWLWYAAAQARYVAEHTHFQQLSFKSTFTGGQVLGLMITNLLLLVVTLGLAFPWILLRNIRFMFDHLQISGELEYQRIRQSAQKVPTTGEGLAEAFDVGVI